MSRIAQPFIAPSRRWLDRGWQMAASEPGSTPPDATGAWWFIDEPMPVAAALSKAGLWSLDVPSRRLDDEAWWYRLEFDVPEANDATWSMGFDGLATLADVWLNGQHVLSTSNMFRSHELQLESALRVTGNVLLIRFDALDTRLAERRPRPRWRVPMVSHQQLRWFRTTLLGRTPGWSPPAPVVGPWKGIWLQRFDRLSSQLQRLEANVDARGLGTLDIEVRIGGPTPNSVGLNLHCGEMQSKVELVDIGNGLYCGRLELPNVQRWWPHTHGEPALYDAVLRVDSGVGEPVLLPLSPVGFRTLRLDHHNDGFSLYINGASVFCRGACWTPLDTLRLHASPQAYADVLTRVRAAGMNMLRVGGTMVYEDAAFLSACDAAGVLVWQDLMFASMDYPGEDAVFLADVEAEVREQASRLQGHACVAVVCGNSEIEQQAAMWGADRECWTSSYFAERLPKIVATALPQTPWWPSSAHGGSFPFQPNAGTCSYYGVGAYLRGVDDARDSGVRFATECLAFANIPTDAALQRVPNPLPSLQVHHSAWKARSPRDLGAGWDFDDVRDHYVERLFGERADLVRRADPARHLALGRAASGEAMARAFTRWRSASSQCSGALVWFLRDLWPGAGWGLLDDACQPKPAFHAIARVLQPLHLGITDDGMNGLSLQLVNERAHPVDAELELTLYRDGEFAALHWRRAVWLDGRSRKSVAATDGLEGFADLNWVYRFGPPAGDVVVATLLDRRAGSERIELTQAFHRVVDGVPHRQADIGLRGEARLIDNDRMELVITTRALAWGVHFDAPGWRAEDEFFNIAPGGRRVTYLQPASAGQPAWRASVAALNGHSTSVPLRSS